MKNKKLIFVLITVLCGVIAAFVIPSIRDEFKSVTTQDQPLPHLYQIDTSNVRIQEWRQYFRVDTLAINKHKRKFYYERIKEMFVEAKFPPEVAALYAEIPTIESNWNNRAISHSGARGLWQFMPKTAKEYGVTTDELMDPEIATRIAIAYIKDLDSLHKHDYVKVLFSYNSGHGVVSSGLLHSKTNNAWLIQFANRETYNFAPKIIGAYLVQNEK